MKFPENGYLYVYVCDESAMDVYFDNLQIIHYTNPLTEVNDYYPFGLLAKTSMSLGGTSQNYKYNGKELQKDLAFNVLDYGARQYDPVIGRWGVIDQKAELYKNITPYAYAANQPTNAIDPNGKLVIFINGFTLNKAEQGTQWYWRQHSNQSFPNAYSWDAQLSFHYNQETVQTGSAFDLQVSQQLGDDNRKYVDGGNIYSSGSRRSAGKAQGYKEAAAIIESLHRTDGVIDESIKFITHSMGGVYGDGYISGLKKYIDEHPELKSQVTIALIADFDPFQANTIENDGITKKMQFTHKGKWSPTGWLANEDEQGPHEFKISQSSGDHSIFSFFDDISQLQEGTYKWNSATQKWELQ